MKYIEAQAELKKILNTQQTVRTNKLRNLLVAMNVSLNKPQDNAEVTYLKNEINKLRAENKRLKSGDAK